MLSLLCPPGGGDTPPLNDDGRGRGGARVGVLHVRLCSMPQTPAREAAAGAAGHQCRARTPLGPRHAGVAAAAGWDGAENGTLTEVVERHDYLRVETAQKNSWILQSSVDFLLPVVPPLMYLTVSRPVSQQRPCPPCQRSATLMTPTRQQPSSHFQPLPRGCCCLEL